MPRLLQPIRWRLKSWWNRWMVGRRQRRRVTPATAATPANDLNRQLLARLKGAGLPTLRQLRHAALVLSGHERRLILGLLLVGALSLAFLAFRFFAARLVAMPIARGAYTEALAGAPQFINPLLVRDNDVDADLSALIFSGLFRYDKHLRLVPDLASGYEVGDDGKTYVVRLKPNLRWHDGQPVSADDVVFTYASAQDPAFRSPLQLSFSGVQVEKVSEREVIFRLSEPYDRFLDLLTVGLLPEHVWGEIPPVNSTLTEYNLNNPIGSGPWRFKALVKDRHGNIRSYTLVPFADYRGARPFLEELTFRFYPDFPSAVAALNSRSVDGISLLPREYEDDVTDPRVTRYRLQLPQYTAIFFNQQAAAVVRDKNIRTALAAALDRGKVLTDALALRGELVEGPILDGYPGFDPNLKATPFDPVRASALLEEAGWPRVELADYRQAPNASSTATTTAATAGQAATTTAALEGMPYVRRNRSGDLLELTLTTVDLPENRAAAELVRQFWQAVGISVSLQIVPKERIVREIIKPRRYQAFLFGELVGSDPDPYLLWHSSQSSDPGLNLAVWSSRELDKILEDARASNEAAAKAEKYREFAQQLVAEIPAIFLYRPVYTYAIASRVKGFDMNAIIRYQDRFNNLNEWYVRSGRRWRPAPD